MGAFSARVARDEAVFRDLVHADPDAAVHLLATRFDGHSLADLLAGTRSAALLRAAFAARLITDNKVYCNPCLPVDVIEQRLLSADLTHRDSAFTPLLHNPATPDSLVLATYARWQSADADESYSQWWHAAEAGALLCAVMNRGLLTPDAVVDALAGPDVREHSRTAWVHGLGYTTSTDILARIAADEAIANLAEIRSAVLGNPYTPHDSRVAILTDWIARPERIPRSMNGHIEAVAVACSDPSRQPEIDRLKFLAGLAQRHDDQWDLSALTETEFTDLVIAREWSGDATYSPDQVRQRSAALPNSVQSDPERQWAWVADTAAVAAAVAALIRREQYGRTFGDNVTNRVGPRNRWTDIEQQADTTSHARALIAAATTNTRHVKRLADDPDHGVRRFAYLAPAAEKLDENDTPLLPAPDAPIGDIIFAATADLWSDAAVEWRARMVTHPEREVRIALARNRRTPTTDLVTLAGDPDPAVAYAVAERQRDPHQADMDVITVLSDSPHDSVRGLMTQILTSAATGSPSP